MNKKTFLILFFSLLGIVPCAQARNCDAFDMQYDAYCAYITGPENTNKFVKITDEDYVETFCANSDNFLMEVEKEFVGKKRNKIGPHYSISFSQCDTILCDNEVPLATDTFTFLPNKTADHDRFGFALNPLFGEDCTHRSFLREGYVTPISAENCGQSPYCVTINNPKEVKKFVKVVSDNGESFTFCTNSNIAYSYSYSSDAPTPIKATAHILQFFQCDTLQCKNQRPIGKDSVTFSAVEKADHKQFSITLDPTFGASCEPPSIES